MKKLLLAFAPLILCIPAPGQSLPDGPNKKLFEDTCGGCHGADIAFNVAPRTKEDWSSTIDNMRGKGAEGSDEDFMKILAYVSKYFGAAVNVNKADAKTMMAELDLSQAEADAIVKGQGKYKAWADLTKVQGVDAKKLEMFKPRITFQ